MRIAWRGLAAAVALGVLLGVFSSRGDGVGIMVVNGLANATSPWVIVAFAVGAVAASPGPGALAGAVALVAGVWTYYVGFLLGGHAFLLPFMGIWSAAAGAAGALFGAAGGAWRDRRDRWRTLAVAAVVGALLAEAAHRLVLFEIWTGIEWERTYFQVAVADLLLAAALLVVLAEAGRRSTALLAAVPLAAAILVTLFGVDAALRWASDVGAGMRGA